MISNLRIRFLGKIPPCGEVLTKYFLYETTRQSIFELDEQTNVCIS